MGHVVRFRRPIFAAEARRELGAVVARPNFDRYSPLAERMSARQLLDGVATTVTIAERIRACADPDDDEFLGAAVNGNAVAIVTGHHQLLRLHPSRAASIVTPADDLRRLRPN